MLNITEKDIADRMRLDNPWWDTGKIDADRQSMKKRVLFSVILELIEQTEINRALVLMGPRRVGKTVLLHHVIQSLIDNGTDPTAILYISLDTPLYNKLPLEKILNIFRNEIGLPKGAKPVIIYDEVQYLKEWEVHLKSLVDTFRDIKFIVSGSAAAALKMKSQESGAGRFTNIVLPPLTFFEYLDFLEKRDEFFTEDGKCKDIQGLNVQFVNYLNYGGYPELALSPNIQEKMSQYVRSDIIDKVLLRDLPSLYGIQDIQELNSLFVSLAYNTGNEITLEELSQSSNLNKATIKRYIEYLESAFLIHIVKRVDQNAKRFKRTTTFKVYLANPSMRAALFGVVTADDEEMGALAETAVFTEVMSAFANHGTYRNECLAYARWKKGEVDLVVLSENRLEPINAVEVKWSDRAFSKPSTLNNSLLPFVEKHQDSLNTVTVTTRTVTATKRVRGHEIIFIPTSELCYLYGSEMDSTINKSILDLKK